MTPEQIEKEKAEKVEKAPVIQPDIEKPEVNSTELGKMELTKQSAPKGSARQFAKNVGDYKRVVQMAKEKGVNLDNIGEMPLMDSDKGKITDAVKSAYGRELATGIQGISDAITAPQNEERNKIDVKAQMALEKKKRRSAWADALYAFGEGAQGKTANPDAFVSTKIQRKQDEQFQQFKETTERNKKTKYLWENQSRKEMIDWADQESKNMQQNQEYRDKMKMLADKYAQDQKNKDRGYKIQEDRNNIARNKKPGSTAKSDEEKLIKVQTAKTTYELKPEEAELYREAVLSNPGKYPKLYNKVQKYQKVNGFDEPVDGEFTYEMKAKYNDGDFVRAYLEENKEGGGQKVAPENQNAYFDKYRKQKGLPTSDVPVSETTKAAPSKQAPKSDPLELFSTGGLY